MIAFPGVTFRPLRRRSQLAAAAVLALSSLPCAAAETAKVASLEGCSAITADKERLTCYDELARRPPPGPAPIANPGAPPVVMDKTAQPVPPAPEPPGWPGRPETELGVAGAGDTKLLSALSRHWELDDEAKQGAFLFRPHHPNYFLPLKFSSAPNNTPFRDTFAGSDLGLESIEAELQLSFKVKAREGVFGNDNIDLWFGYTATSFWQSYNRSISAPFRETNYEPEAMLVFRTDYPLLGFRGRFVSLGLSHQSNGRGEGLSRSWNRVYAQFGFERDNLSVMIRPWVRIPENDRNDDNPDIEDYMGHGDLLAQYRSGKHTYSLLFRNNFQSPDNRGAFKLNWSFPLYGRLKGYVQYFNGYGESLIDYNHHQQSVGVGISLTEGM